MEIAQFISQVSYLQSENSDFLFSGKTASKEKENDQSAHCRIMVHSSITCLYLWLIYVVRVSSRPWSTFVTCWRKSLWWNTWQVARWKKPLKTIRGGFFQRATNKWWKPLICTYGGFLQHRTIVGISERLFVVCQRKPLNFVGSKIQ